jgi:uncharacterized protein
MSIIPPPKPRLWIWFIWITCFFAAWSTLILTRELWPTAVAHWPIALAMALGSYAAGSTPMGGGTVGFPILVLLFDQPATLGRDFSFAVQSIGMVSASFLIIARRQTVAWAMLKGAALGSLVGTPLGIFFLAPHIPGLWIKLVFAVVWGSFGLLHLWRLREIASHDGMTDFSERWDFRVGLAIGLGAGATVASVTGVGIDMVLYTVLVLLCRADLKIAIPTSVMIMAFTSLVGLATKVLFTGLEPGVFENWIAAAPVVALGAPLGVIMVAYIGRRPTLLVVAVLCVLQFLWTLHVERATLGTLGVSLSLLALALCLLAFEQLRRYGGLLVAQARSRNGTPGGGAQIN